MTLSPSYDSNEAILGRMQVLTQVDTQTMTVEHNLTFTSICGHVLGWRWGDNTLQDALVTTGLYANHGLMTYLEAALLTKKMRELASERVR